jgi:hypothetical protein
MYCSCFNFFNKMHAFLISILANFNSDLFTGRTWSEVKEYTKIHYIIMVLIFISINIF